MDSSKKSTTIYTDEISNTIKKARGERLESLRGLSRLSRKDVEQKLLISAQTLNYWEKGLEAGLTEKGAERVVSAFRKFGIYCTVNWLLHGLGSSPQISSRYYSSNDQTILQNDQTLNSGFQDDAINEEIAYLYERYTNFVHFQVEDDGMLPLYSMGDYVAGYPRYMDSIGRLIELNCIVETIDGNKYLRKLRSGRSKGTYILGCINSETSCTEPTIYDVKLLCATPVIWHRKKDIY